MIVDTLPANASRCYCQLCSIDNLTKRDSCSGNVISNQSEKIRTKNYAIEFDVSFFPASVCHAFKKFLTVEFFKEHKNAWRNEKRYRSDLTDRFLVGFFCLEITLNHSVEDSVVPS